jgi:hypothetical protein
MIMAPVAGILKVIGKRIAIAPTGPIPGSTPTSVPSTEPTKQKKRFCGSRAILNPYRRLFSVSRRYLLLPSQYASGKLDLQTEMENDVGQHDCHKGSGHAYPELWFPQGIEEYHDAECHNKKTDTGEERCVEEKGDHGDQHILPFEPSPGIGQYPFACFPERGLDNQDQGKYPADQAGPEENKAGAGVGKGADAELKGHKKDEY